MARPKKVVTEKPVYVAKAKKAKAPKVDKRLEAKMREEEAEKKRQQDEMYQAALKREAEIVARIKELAKKERDDRKRAAMTPMPVHHEEDQLKPVHEPVLRVGGDQPREEKEAPAPAPAPKEHPAPAEHHKHRVSSMLGVAGGASHLAMMR